MGGAQPTVMIWSESVDGLAELVTASRGLGSGRLRVVAAVVGAEARTTADLIARCGTDEVYTITAVDGATDSATVAAALQCVAATTGPDVVLVGASHLGADVAPRLAQHFGVPCASNCMSVALCEDGAIELERRVYGGRFIARQVLRARPAIATVQLKRYERAEVGVAEEAAVKEFEADLPPIRIQRTKIVPRSRSEVDITKAEVIIGAGRGIKRVEDLDLLNELARLLGGVVAGSRPLTGDLDWLPVDRRIGLSGQTVKPNLYVACGISGQIEHIVGMKGARTVVAINNDANAPIHEEADYSIVADLYEVLPELTRRLGGSASGQS